jgi:oxygen-dependent protoporphyrinogen oxidase
VTPHACSRPKRIAVIGGGITGLATTYELRKRRPDLDVLLFESKPGLGGNVDTVHADGFLLDGGPDSFLRTKPEAAQLCEELGLGSELITPLPTAHRVFIGQGERLVPLPAGMALAVPTRLRPLLETPLVSFAGKLRILGDLFIDQNGHRDTDETVAAFLERHFGREVTHRLAGPLLGGIFAGDIEELSVRSTFPQLVDLEKRQGSLIRALFAAERARVAKARGIAESRPEDPFDPVELFELFRWLRREGQALPPSPFQSLKGGIGVLIRALADRIPPSALRLGQPITKIVSTGRGFSIHRDGDEPYDSDAVVLCTPAHASARILEGWGNHRMVDALASIPYVSTATVFFGLRRPPARQSLEGAGFIVPRGEGRMLASTWVSSKWSGRAPEGEALVRVFLGGAREPALVESATDLELERLAKEELERFIGPIDEELRMTRVFRWIRSNPQPVLGHADRLATLRDALRDTPTLALAGSAYDGVGLPDCIRQGRAAAQRVLDGLGGR